MKMETKNNKKRLIIGSAIGGFLVLAGSVIVGRINLLTGFEDGWKCCTNALNEIDPEACEGFMDTVNISWD